MRRNAFLLLLPLVLVFAFGCETNDSLIEPEAAPIRLNASSTGCTVGTGGGTVWSSSYSSHGNSFTACMDGVATEIELSYGYHPDPNATVTLSLFNGNTVSGTAAYTQSGVTLSGSYGIDQITLATPFPVTNGSQYTFEVDVPSPVEYKCVGTLPGESAYLGGTEHSDCNLVYWVHIEPSAVIPVDIDIKPGSYPNCFNNDGHGVIPVAILGSADFDVTQIDPSSVELAGLTVGARGKSGKLMSHIEDVNGDGFDDLVVQIEDVDGTFTSGTGTATLTGNLLDGRAFEGSDEICVVSNN